MTYSQFESLIEKYYGSHKSEYVQETTMKYIKTTYPEKALDKLRIAILKTHRYSFGFPDVSAIETAHEKLTRNDSYNLKKKESRPYSEDLSISDEEWKEGFQGMEVLKKAVEIGFNENISEKENIRLDPEIMDSVKRELSANS